ncbi:MAG TPA: hypothetical protein VGR00_13280, partial [Thermoanaerobaculia bacterium]|nr:hypothetical protein [Thermoanaerobaculia bacterium]
MASILPALLTLSALAAPGTPAVLRDPRPLSDAEREAVSLAAGYLERGPSAWWDSLARSSPLRRLGRDEALLELEARLGPPGGAQW